MNKKALICIVIIAILSLCKFNNVVAVPSRELAPNTYNNYAGSMREKQQT
jgi:hypothetical protein